MDRSIYTPFKRNHYGIYRHTEPVGASLHSYLKQVFSVPSRRVRYEDRVSGTWHLNLVHSDMQGTATTQGIHSKRIYLLSHAKTLRMNGSTWMEGCFHKNNM